MSNEKDSSGNREDIFSKKDLAVGMGLGLAGGILYGAYKLMWGTTPRKIMTVLGTSIMLYTNSPGIRNTIGSGAESASNWYNSTFVAKPLEEKVMALEGKLAYANGKALKERIENANLESQNANYKARLTQQDEAAEKARQKPQVIQIPIQTPQVIHNTTNNFYTGERGWAIVPAGSTLSLVAEKITGDPFDYRIIAKASGIRNPDDVVAGELVIIPAGLARNNDVLRLEEAPIKYIMLKRGQTLEKYLVGNCGIKGSDAIEMSGRIRQYNSNIGNNAVDMTTCSERKVWLNE